MKAALVLAVCVVLAFVAALALRRDDDPDSPAGRRRESQWKSRLARLAPVPRVRPDAIATSCRNRDAFVLPQLGACTVTIAPDERQAVRELELTLRQGSVGVQVEPAEPEEGESLLVGGSVTLRPGQPRRVQFGREGGRLTLRCAGTLCVVRFE